MGDSLVFLFSDLGLGGVQTKMISLVNDIVQKHHSCVVLLQTKKGFTRINELDERVKILCPIDIDVLGKHPFWGWRFGIFVLVALIFLKPRKIFVSLAPLSIFILRAFYIISPWLLKRVVINEDTYPSLYYSGGHVKGTSVVEIKKWYPKARAVIGVSRSTYADLKKNFKISSPPLVYIPNWISDTKKPSSNKKSRAIDIVYAGRLAKQKQPLVLANVFSRVLKMRPKTIIHVYADGPMKEEFLIELVRLKITRKIKFHDPIQKMTHILCQSKCLLFASEFEGMPFIGLEAMECGAVVAGLDVPGVMDIVTDGKTGILAESQEELSNKVIKLLSDTKMRDRFAGNANKRVHREFSEKNRDKLTDLLLEK